MHEALSSMSCQYLNVIFFLLWMLVANVPSNSVADWKFQLLKSSPRKTPKAEDTPQMQKPPILVTQIFFTPVWQKKTTNIWKTHRTAPPNNFLPAVFLNFLLGTPPKHENCWFTWKGAPLEKGETSTNHQFWNHRIIENPNQKKYSPEIPNKVFPFLFKGLFQ